ncbi:MAG: BatA domain-containing protein, partial [Planctomycetota bacterium]
MTFLNPILLIGLAAAAIPIIIHILNRRRAHVVDWAAMRFLEDSLTSRSRRILIEELILMVVRCALLALLAFALARPFVQTGRLLGGDSADAQDIAVVLDGSLSMTLESEGASMFDRGVAEARQVLGACREHDAVSVLVAGAAVEAVIPKPLSDREAIGRRLRSAPARGADESAGEDVNGLTPTGGTLDVPGALTEAIRSLAAGGNPAKKIVLITDGQSAGWDLSTAKRWAFLAEESRDALKIPPTVVVRTLPPPAQWRNVAVGQVNFSRSAIGTDREVEVSVTLNNTGAGAVEPEAVELTVDGKGVEARQRPPEIAEGASATVTFRHRFRHPGPSIVAATVRCEDDLPGDNRTVRVVNVIEQLPVLVVEGKGSPRPLEGDAGFLMLALAPPADEEQDEAPDHLIRATLVQAHEIGSVRQFDPYRVVILADVPRLPRESAEALAEFVAGGGGLLIAPGPKADKAFYDGWLGPDQQRLAGCRLEAFQAPPRPPNETERFCHVAPNTIDSPAIRILADPAVSDLSAARIRRRWVTAVDRDADASVGAALDRGEPYLVQRRLGGGLVITLSVPLDAEHSDLPLHKCYVPLVHELTYYLAAPGQYPMNVHPGQRLIWAISGPIRSGDAAEVVAPTLRRWPARLSR